MPLRLRLITALTLVACSPKTDPTESASDTSDAPGSSGSTSASDSISAGHSQTSAPTASDTATTLPGGTGGQTVTTASPSEPGTISATDGIDSDPSPGTVSTVTTGIMSTGGPCQDDPNQPHSAACTDESGCGCASDRCFIVPALGGFCSECFGDADCPGGGCTVPNPVAGTGAACNSGQAGDGCQTDAACNDPAAPRCAEMFSIPGIITAATCGQCETDADCPPQAPHCTPDYDLANFGGRHVCRSAGSVPNNSGCDFPGTGDQACASGHCGQALLMTLIKFGVCGQCTTDSDCGPGQQCSEPAVDLDQGALIGSVCL